MCHDQLLTPPPKASPPGTISVPHYRYFTGLYRKLDSVVLGSGITGGIAAILIQTGHYELDSDPSSRRHGSHRRWLPPFAEARGSRGAHGGRAVAVAVAATEAAPIAAKVASESRPHSPRPATHSSRRNTTADDWLSAALQYIRRHHFRRCRHLLGSVQQELPDRAEEERLVGSEHARHELPCSWSGLLEL